MKGVDVNARADNGRSGLFMSLQGSDVEAIVEMMMVVDSVDMNSSYATGKTLDVFVEQRGDEKVRSHLLWTARFTDTNENVIHD